VKQPEDDHTQSFTPLPQGTVISHYRIVQIIGIGGMGEVYLAEDTELERKVALKFMPQQFLFSSDARARFKREAQAAAALSHPNIIHIYEVSEYQGRPFFAMEYVAGQSLGDLIKAKELGLDKIIDLAMQICKGLHKAHQAGITHRDVKPSNIVIDADGQPKLLDFGLAAVQSTEKLTKTGSTLGTIGYMSPEQIQVKEIDQRSDLFSFGVLLYEMITGRLPFKGDTEAATLNSVLHDIPEPLSRYKSGVSGELQGIASKLLEKDPELRYQSAAGVVSDLKRLSVDVVPVADKPPRDWWNRYVVVAAVIVIVALAGYWILTRNGQQTAEKPEKIRLVVLPFENLGNTEDEYFADGITDEITSRLTKLSALGVISRSSAIQYKKTKKDPRQIAEELDVDFILEGTIRWEKSGTSDRVRITPQLIDISDNTHLWAENYEREISAIFDVQVEIASKIVSVLDVTLIQQEQDALKEKPTDNFDAYQAYLKGMSFLWEADYTAENMEASTKLLERAVDFDPEFIGAQSALADAHSNLYHFGYDRTSRRLEMAKKAIDRALELDAGHPDVLLAVGTYYYVQRDYARALEKFIVAGEKSPGSFKVVWAIAATYRRQGRLEEALLHFQKCVVLNPRSAFVFEDVGFTYQMLRRYSEADSCFDRIISLAPDQTEGYISKAELKQQWKGDLKAAREILESTPVQASSYSSMFHAWWLQEILERDYRAALNRLMAAEEDIHKSQFFMHPIILYKAQCHQLLGDTEMAREAYDSARALLEAKAEELPADFRVRSALGIAYAGLGRTSAAVREADLAVKLMPIENDILYGTHFLQEQAYTYAMAGEYEKAIDKFAYLLSLVQYYCIGRLRLDPRLDPLRDHPRFQVLLEKYEKEHGN